MSTYTSTRVWGSETSFGPSQSKCIIKPEVQNQCEMYNMYMMSTTCRNIFTKYLVCKGNPPQFSAILRYYATFKVRKFESFLYKINTCLQKTTTCIGYPISEVARPS